MYTRLKSLKAGGVTWSKTAGQKKKAFKNFSKAEHFIEVACTCDPSYSGGKDQEDCGSRAGFKSPYFENI
jgi:hypothetical protein